MMAIVNGRFLARQVTGVERYGREILHALGDDRLRVVRPGSLTTGWRGHTWEQFVLPGRIRPGEVLWSPANTGPLYVANQVLTLHDLSPLDHPEWYKPAFARWYRLFLPLLVRRVRRIIAPSEYVREKVLLRFSLQKEKVVCIPEGVDPQKFHPAKMPGRSTGRRSEHPYVLFVGTLTARKNLAGLLRAWELVRSSHPDHILVLAGSGGDVFRPALVDEQAEQVQFRGRVAEADLPVLYAGAELFVLPSFDEGFGLTALEAMACGVPVVAAQAGALPEVIGEAGIYFNPQESSDLAVVLERCLCDPALRARLRQKGLDRATQFSWRSSSEKTWQVLQECI